MDWPTSLLDFMMRSTSCSGSSGGGGRRVSPPALACGLGHAAPHLVLALDERDLEGVLGVVDGDDARLGLAVYDAEREALQNPAHTRTLAPHPGS